MDPRDEISIKIISSELPKVSSPGWVNRGSIMRTTKFLGTFACAFASFLFAAGCSHLPSSGGFSGGGGSAPVTLMFHDTPMAGIAVTSFEATVTGATLQPQSGSTVSLISAPQTIELTQLQTNSTFLSTTAKVGAATYTSLTITFANPQYTILNDGTTSLTIFGKPCGVGQTCVVTPTGGTLTNTITGFLSSGSTSSSPLVIGSNQPTLLEVDVNLNTIIQSDFTVNFGSSGAVTATQLSSSSSTSVIDTLAISGAITAVGTNPNEFSLSASTGQTFSNIAVTTSTQFSQFDQASRNSTCTANNFTCLVSGQIVDVQLQILGTGAYQAAEVDFDDAASTQQVSGTVIALGSGSPPSSFTMIVHNTVPTLSTIPVGTPVTVTIKSGATFLINNGLFVLSSGSFASGTDLLVGQEAEARVSGSVTVGPPVTFTADRLALEQTQLMAAVNTVSAPDFTLNSLPALFSNNPAGPVLQIQVVTSPTQTTFQDLTNDSISGIAPPDVVSVGGFLFSAPGNPSLGGVTVRGQVPGT
jgi:hypothetical protein